jgi:molybdate transport system substrate-binding protein
MVGALLVGLLGCFAACARTDAAPAPVRVAAAADLSKAFEALGRAFEQQSGRKVVFSFGSTGLLARQLREGAPFDLFAAANVAFVDAVVRAGACDGSTRAPYARGRIAIWSQQRSAAAPPATLGDLADPRFAHIAIANPEHAPYGQAAREALMTAGVWEQVQPRLVYGENVRQALQLAETGNASAAIVALALVIEDGTNPWTLIDESLHRPIDQALVVCRHGAAADGGRAFAAYIDSAAGRAVMRRHGFVLPGEELGSPP